MDQFTGSGTVSQRNVFDVAALQTWLSQNMACFSGPLEIEQFNGGQSNPTYKLITPGRAYVMRSKPGPRDKLLPSAHAIEREFKVMDALALSGVPVARMHVLCEDESVIGRAFYVMEFVPGKPLDEALKPGECEIRHAMDLVARICDAVDYAHQRGVLHRDLKPSNILIDTHGDPHLLDFGLAKRVEDAGAAGGAHGRLGVTIAEPGQLVGTVAYMSPEQTLGKTNQTGVRSDVYALGVIAYELVAGKLPVEMEGSIREVLTRIAEKEPAPASAARSGVSRDLDAVLLRALEKNPARRYATAGEFASDLRLFLTGMPVTARRVGAVGRSWRWVMRNQAIASVIAAAAVILVTVSTWAIARIIVERDRANDAATQKAIALEASVAEAVDARES
jgi:serine/threonine protein kinase